MSVNSHLLQKSASAILSTTEKESISRSIATLRSRLDSWFGKNLTTHFTFGSFTRETILPRSLDAQSDIDYMVVFAEGGNTPQTYLNRLKTFVEKYYSSSEIFQSSPTIVLNLNHIRFELVPALAAYWTGYQIPSGPQNWQDTDPNGFNTTLSQANKSCSYLLKPAVRLFKIWNARRSYPFESYALEKWMADQSYWSCSTVGDHLFHAVDNAQLSYYAPQWKIDELTRAREIVANTRYYLASDMPINAESEIKKLIPE
ncbi:nucleotidyltransferase [Devosia ginsengisoli]|uniref:SMODS domain-containing nucleotidyltransferase n=1 Tax=Devosia ginsengisoli TaxID=400770 RepID=UPI0026EC742F|nr:nucleotidyltransferase [Devosia ginsengisoli]MCR6672707.1 nucleotidyltransferase [Devosia ginsengisoli]